MYARIAEARGVERLGVGDSALNAVGRSAAIFATAISIAAFFLALVGGGLAIALADLLNRFGGLRTAGMNAYPLGAGILVLYACAAAVGFAGLRWPKHAGLGLLALSVGAYLFGGPIAQVFAILIAAAGAVLLASRLLARGA